MEFPKINYYGRLRRVPRVAGKTYSDNALEVGLCDPCNALPGCEDTLTIVAANAVTSILYGHMVYDAAGVGTEVQTTIPLGTTGGAATAAAIEAALALYEFDIYVTATDVSTNFVLKHRGQGRIISALVVTTGTVTATRICTIATQCDYIFPVGGIGGTIATIEVDGTDRALTDIVYGTDSAATAKSRMDTALALASLTGGAVSTFAVDTAPAVYRGKIVARDGHSFVIGSTGPTATTTLQKTNCQQIFA